MQKSDLKHFCPVWEHKFIDDMYDTEFERILRGDQYLGEESASQNFLGDARRPIAQDVIRALIIRNHTV